jgi:hypothetical protein
LEYAKNDFLSGNRKKNKNGINFEALQHNENPLFTRIYGFFQHTNKRTYAAASGARNMLLNVSASSKKPCRKSVTVSK